MVFLQRFYQSIATVRNVADFVALGFEGVQNVDGAGRRVIAHSIGDAAVLVGIVGEDDCDALLGIGSFAQPCPVQCEIGDEGDAVRNGPVGDDAALGFFIPCDVRRNARTLAMHPATNGVAMLVPPSNM